MIDFGRNDGTRIKRTSVNVHACRMNTHAPTLFETHIERLCDRGRPALVSETAVWYSSLANKFRQHKNVRFTVMID
ncbi:hypothetical protein EG68_04404 [Paragonimus skrjabini miyazakii]|uniref:Uncharacterized protein n=1 Tax=Paragonimus skrjabini miyazakii TaxID=59628 RepID=A0A8S9Z310_9TREM|nr:hypothetical protein EG68_04404 [Paragonimus skrjabini miyazakii]